MYIKDQYIILVLHPDIPNSVDALPWYIQNIWGEKIRIYKENPSTKQNKIVIGKMYKNANVK